MIQYILFTMLVVATPFVVVTKFLQGAVYKISHLSFTVLGLSLPFVAAAAVLLLVATVIWQRKNITPRRIAGALVVVGMIAWSQWLQDLYGGMSVYDLQKNWHYVAYTAYVFMFFRTFHMRGVSKSKMILASFFSAIALSTFDEFFQLKMSNRIFDVSDIAKDSWGAMMGLILVLFVSETYGRVELGKHSIRQKRLGDYSRAPLAALTITGVCSLSAVMISPLLTDQRYALLVLLLTFCVSAVGMLVVHFSQIRGMRIAFAAIAALVIVPLGGSVLMHRNTFINYNTYNLTVYKGIPIPFFDLLIYPDGMPRLVDKKHFFNNQDKQFLLGQEPSILLMGSGAEGNGGRGFKESEEPHFMFNKETMKETQIIILKTPQACEVFNRLKREGKNVLFVLHNSC